MVLDIDKISKRYNGKIAINNFSVSLHPGVYGLLGPNGAGKTTLMRVVCGLTRPDSGSVFYDRKSIRDLGEEYRKILGYLPQNFGYYPSFTVQRYMEYIASLKGLNKNFSKRKISELLEIVGLQEAPKAKISSLSGGMRQRLGIAQSMLNDPDVLILDEPTVGLDPAERVKFRNLISTISQGKITILSTHIVSDISYIADDILLVQRGQLQYFGNVQQLTTAVEGKVWEVLAENQQANKIAQDYIVSNIHHTPQGAILRIISDQQPFQQAKAVSPTLEDAYLFYTGERGGEL